MKKTLLFVLILANVSMAFAAAEHRPKVALVLSGGGARGSAHIGVIEVLEEMQVPIDLIVGTSMGAVIGGLYASGVPIAQIKKDFLALNWESIFKYDIPREELYYRRKQDTDIFLIKNFIRIDKGKLQVASGLTTGQSLYEIFNAYFLPLQPIQNFNDLKIPFKAVATDLTSSNVVVLEQGDLAMALVASMAVPGLIAPVKVDKYMLVDGGVSNNLPIDVAKKMGADIIIAVNVSTPLFDESQMQNVINILEQVTNILSNDNTNISKSLLTKKDIFIEPDVSAIDTEDFNKFAEGIPMGRKATYQHASQLKKLHIDRPTAMAKKILPPVQINKAIVHSEGILSAQTYRDYVEVTDIEESMKKLYGISIFNHVYYGIEEKDHEKVLVVQPEVIPPETIYLQGSLLLEADSQSNNSFSLIVGFTRPQVNAWLGEWRVIGTIGDDTGLFAEFYQPITPSLVWFANPYAYWDRSPIIAYFDYDEVATVVGTLSQVGFNIGRTFSTTAQIYGFWEFDYFTFQQRTGEPFLQGTLPKDGRVGVTFEWDTLDNLFFPHRGVKGSISYLANNKSFGGDTNFRQLNISSYIAGTSGNHSIVTGGMYNATVKGQADYQSQFFLGGIFQLAGLVQDELEGDNSALYDLVYFYKLSRNTIFSDIYVGASLEAGRVWRHTNLSTKLPVIGAGSLFLGIDSLIGPIYLVIGTTDNGKKAAYFTLRPFFRSDFNAV